MVIGLARSLRDFRAAMEGGNELGETGLPIPCPASAPGVGAEANPEVMANPALAWRKKRRREGISSSDNSLVDCLPDKD
jgi:hypothetical protein